jgi:hypothetical protein
MLEKHLKISALFLLFGGLTGLHAQDASFRMVPAPKLANPNTILTSGGESSGSNGTASYSVGQVFYETKNGTDNSVAEGVQQAYEISIVTAIKEAKGISLGVSALPNPVTDYLTLTVDNADVASLRFQLYDIQGKLLQNGDVISSTTRISMNNFAPATYFVKVVQGDKVVKTFKIIKK